MDNAFIGEVRLFGGNFAPYQWAFCNGQILQINQYTTLFSIIGISYGGNGTTNFALPNFQSNIPVGTGQGPGLTNRISGDQFGEQGTTLTTQNLPSHNHIINATSTNGTASTPTANIFGNKGRGDLDFTTTVPNVQMSPLAIGVSGNSQPVSNIQPVLALNFIIALYGTFPARS